MQAADANKALPLGAWRLAGAQEQQHQRRRRQRRQHPSRRQHPPVLPRRPPMAAAAARVHHAVPPIRGAAAPAHARVSTSCAKQDCCCSFSLRCCVVVHALAARPGASCFSIWHDAAPQHAWSRGATAARGYLGIMLATISVRLCAAYMASRSASSTDQQPEGGSAVLAHAVFRCSSFQVHSDAGTLTCDLCR